MDFVTVPNTLDKKQLTWILTTNTLTVDPKNKDFEQYLKEHSTHARLRHHYMFTQTVNDTAFFVPDDWRKYIITAWNAVKDRLPYLNMVNVYEEIRKAYVNGSSDSSILPEHREYYYYLGIINRDPGVVDVPLSEVREYFWKVASQRSSVEHSDMYLEQEHVDTLREIVRDQDTPPKEMDLEVLKTRNLKIVYMYYMYLLKINEEERAEILRSVMRLFTVKVKDSVSVITKYRYRNTTVV